MLNLSCGTIEVDWIKAVLPVLQQVLRRAVWEDFGERQIRVANAEELLLLKLIAFRPRDQEDIQGVLAANRGRLDLDWVRDQWSKLVDMDDPRTIQFERFVAECYQDEQSP